MGTLWFGGPIYTLQEEGHKVEAVLTEGDKILQIGSKEELETNYKEFIHLRRDLEGSTLLPGFVDSHMHLIGHGERLIRLNLSHFTSKDELLEAVKAYSKQFKPGEWIIGEGWNENLWDNPEPVNKDDLDRVAPEHPVILKRICRHAIAVNSLAMQRASIHRNTDCPDGGVIEKDKQGNPVGIFKEQAQELILSVVPEVSEDYLKVAMQAAIKDAHRLGLTGGHTEDLNYYGGFWKTYNTFINVIEEEPLRFRAHLLVHHEVSEDFKGAGGEFLKGNEWIEFGAFKAFADGALGGRTALLSHPYADDPSTNGVAIYSQEQLNDIVLKARKMNMPVAIHTIGDLAFDMALQAIEENPLQGSGRDRLIHAQILRKDLIERAKNLPLILDIQPSFVASDFPWVIERIGHENMTYCYAWKTLLGENIPCAGGSDAPIESLDPLLGIYTAVTRSKVDGEEIYNANEALSVYEAVSLFTKGSAYAACHEHDRGEVKPGYFADFTILKQNIFSVPYNEIHLIEVDKTVVGGEIVYEKNQ
ncbi:amidohydrolase [Cytobacillus sp. FJAT-54145]|uniref:Amidohydrolase n=1 Tax=Cytobacillus spartinae TaxID=3299023 RepID=A0ABW6KMW2_9BACI